MVNGHLSSLYRAYVIYLRGGTRITGWAKEFSSDLASPFNEGVVGFMPKCTFLSSNSILEAWTW